MKVTIVIRIKQRLNQNKKEQKNDSQVINLDNNDESQLTVAVVCDDAQDILWVKFRRNLLTTVDKDIIVKSYGIV